jgi:hypothetical protein
MTMTHLSPRTIEATFENGLLRPLEPIQDLGNHIYLVTILDLDTLRTTTKPNQGRSPRGKYRGYLSSADDFARSKQEEKMQEL